MYNNLIIRNNRVKELILAMNKEKVFSIWQYGQEIFNGLQYDEVSNKFNEIERG